MRDSSTSSENTTHDWAAIVTLHADGFVSVAALSEWLTHTNRRTNGSWAQTYEHGVPTTDLTPVADDGTTGTTVHFQPDRASLMSLRVMMSELQHAASWPQLRVELVDRRPS